MDSEFAQVLERVAVDNMEVEAALVQLLGGLLIVLWSGLWICRRDWLWLIIMRLDLWSRKSWCSLLMIVGLRCDRGGVSGSHMAETLRWTGGSMGMVLMWHLSIRVGCSGL